MEGAEDRTVSRLKQVRSEVWQATIEAAGGRVVNILADSVLAEFDSAAAAVAAAFQIQEGMARFNKGLVKQQRLVFRIGLHLGEVIVDEAQTIFGDAVNVAARIQLMAKPGGVAVSQAFRDTTHLQVDYAFVDGGKHHARNVGRTLRIYHVRARESTSDLLACAAGWSASRTITIGRSTLWGTVAVATLLFAVGGYLTFAGDPMTPVRVAARTLSADQLELALAERRKADVLQSEKRQLQEQARQMDEAESAARQQADTELESARQARQKAERDLAELKADIDARRQANSGKREQTAAATQRAVEETARRHAEAAAAAMRAAEANAAKKAAADAAAARQLNQALAMAKAARQQAEGDTAAAAGNPAFAGIPQNASDGLWRGTYACGPNGNSVPFTLQPAIHVKDGVGTWYTVGRSWTSNTIGITVSIKGTNVLATRQSVAGGGSVAGGATASTSSLSGRLEGNSINASNKACTMVLTRDPLPERQEPANVPAPIQSTRRVAGL